MNHLSMKIFVSFKWQTIDNSDGNIYGNNRFKTNLFYLLSITHYWSLYSSFFVVNDNSYINKKNLNDEYHRMSRGSQQYQALRAITKYYNNSML